MRLIGYLYNTLCENYDSMQQTDFNQLSGQISQLLEQASALLPQQPQQQQPQEQQQQAPFTPPARQESLSPPPIQRNQSDSNVTTTRGSHFMDLSTNDMPMTIGELDDTESDDEDDTSSFFNMNSDEYEEYVSYKNKPKLTTKWFSRKDYLETTNECVVCCEEYNLHQTLTLGCGHEFCRECVCGHFHHSVENQPYKRFYSCPICRADVKKVRINYSRINAKDKKELMASPLVNLLKNWCK